LLAIISVVPLVSPRYN